MAVGTSPIARRRRLGLEVHSLRNHYKLTAEQLAGQLGWSASKLSRIENARVRTDVGDVMDLLDVLGVTDAKRDELIMVARDAANSRGWWNAFPSETLEAQRATVELENGAITIRNFQLTLVPGLLQTREYALARFGERQSIGLPPIDTEEAVQLRMERQQVLTRDAPLAYEALLDESMLLRRCGPPGVRAGQLRHLAKVAAELPNVTIRILPLDAEVTGFHVPLCSFSLYEFADPVDPELVTLETVTSNLQLGDDEDVERYKLIYQRLWDAAFPPEYTLTMLTTVLADAERNEEWAEDAGDDEEPE